MRAIVQSPLAGRPLKPRATPFLVVGFVWAVVVSSLTQISTGGLSLSGLATLATAAAAFAFLPLGLPARVASRGRSGASDTHEPLLQRGIGNQPVPITLWLFVMLAITWMFARPTSGGLQNVAVYGGFVAVVAVVASASSAGTSHRVMSWMTYASVIVCLVYGTTVAVSGTGASTIYNARSFALTALVLLAVVIPQKLSGWRRFLPLFIAVLVLLSVSRTAFAIALLMLTFVVLRGRKRGRLIRGVATLVAIAAVGYLLITTYSPLTERFTVGDDAIQYGGLKINSSGRTVLWEKIAESAARSPIYGQGPGSAGERVDQIIGGTIGHPHNDYLRLYHDVGVVGLALFVIGVLSLIAGAVRRAKLYVHDPVHWAAALGMAAVLLAAFTDNVIVYPFVMIPLAVVVGASRAYPGQSTA